MGLLETDSGPCENTWTGKHSFTCGHDIYPRDVIVLATLRGYNHKEHMDALSHGALDRDEVSLTHPVNWLTEDEAEVYFA